MKRKAALLLAGCVFLAACSGGGGTASSTASSQAAEEVSQAQEETSQAETAETEAEETPADTAEGQYYSSFMDADPATLDISLRADSYSSEIMLNTMEGLVRTGEENGSYVILPALAETWEVNEDGTVWTFHLRDSVWEDGEKVTADQFVYSLRRSADPATGSPSAFFLQPILNFGEINAGEKPVEELGVEAPDDNTLVITLSQPTPSFMMMIDATVYYPQREDKIAEFGDKSGSEAEYYISNGPYRLESWVHNNSIVLVKNENYWDADNVSIETVTIKIMGDITTAYNAFQSGEIDSVYAEALEWRETFEAQGDCFPVDYPSASMGFATFNNKDELFSNVNMRKAFTLAIDLDEMNEMCFSGMRSPAQGWVCDSMSVEETNYRDRAGNMMQAMRDDMEAEGMTPQDVLLKGMEELGLGDDPSTLQVTMGIGGTDEWYRTLGEYLQQVWKTELGVDVTIDYNEWGIFVDNIMTGNYQIGFLSWGAYYNDPYDVLSLYLTDLDMVMTGFSNAEFDALVTAAASEMDLEKRIQNYIDAEEILIRQECVVCPVACAEAHYYYKNYVKGYATMNFNKIGLKGMSTGER
ncbi:MAG: peptide ABC transporter substrate-binding protein [Lachnospiraceae bacterium]|nr:peptide ABC transporter substrate-binding protein [Lachnospiraceae bacterium]